ncbi:universal stress protein UspA [Pseudomonas aeruginosa]|uniref:universal stress protein n=1 Tax=Pseudomonas aeruginosa TaxID=287 RepID=UPI000F89C270|nr:universal stress protein [Pseudomonas aeruginosa]MBG4604127.1 universal stress protein [Pseudomonas aeruginosa]MBH8258132.1 universal stress protein [Pseudomonas aeruginosa]MCV3907725.1 universal stress protein [Pseudomonas aeruginosa]NPS39634.1 universal stress protein [Pseudomonas aeruginosa]NPS89106.1 universal stress protein [Pseudomonas aeruginosa]
MIKRILVAYDASPAAELALNFANDLAERFGASLYILSVAQPPEFGDEVETEAVIERSRTHFHQAFNLLGYRRMPPEDRPTTHVSVGRPAEQIVRYAEEHDIDHIVIGHRGHSRFERWLLGSVARQVIDHAPCAVTVIRD